MTDVTSPPSASAAAERPRRHRFLIGTLLTLATLAGVFAVLAVWVNRQALNANNITDTSSKILADKQVQTALSAYLVNELFKSVDVQAQLKTNLPPQLQGLAGPIAGGVREVAGRAVPALLATPAAQNAFRQGVHAADTTLLKIVDGGGNVVSTNGGQVTLDLHALVAQLAATLGLQKQAAAVQSKLQGGGSAKARSAAQQKLGVTLPPKTGELVLMRSSQLKTVQDVAGGIKGLAIALPLIAAALFALAVWLAKGRRRRALRTVGWLFLAIGVVVLLVRRVAGNEIVDRLVKVESNKTAVHNIWTIGTSLLYDIAVALVVLGAVLVVAAWLAGQTRAAAGLRRALAPSLREHPVRAYGTAGVALLLLILWGPTPATRQIVPLALLALLLALGVHLLREQTASEFPDAHAGDATASLRARWAHRREPEPHADEHVADIERLAALHDRGVLNDAEFAAEKSLILRNGSS